MALDLAFVITRIATGAMFMAGDVDALVAEQREIPQIT
jgi:hypothetical protein